MIKKIIKFFAFLIILLLLLVIYLSYFGIETKKFNQLIEDRISTKNSKINIELKKIKILLNISDFSFSIKTINPKIFYNKKQIKLDKISTNFSLNSFFNKDLFIDDLEISSQEIKIKDILFILSSYRPSIELLIIENMIKEGTVIADANLRFDNKGNIKKDYELNVSIKDGLIKAFGKKNISNINLNLNIKDNNYSLKNLDLNFDEIKFFSKLINVKKVNKNLLVNGDIKNNNSDIKSEILNLIFKDNFDNFESINFNSENKFSFLLNKKFKIKDLKLKSNIFLNSLKYNYNASNIKNFLPNFNNKIELNKHVINLDYQKNQINIAGKGTFSINNDSEFIEYILEKKENNYLFKSKVKINNNPILIKFLDYKKEAKYNSEIKFEGFINEDQNIFLKSLSFIESKNNFIIKDLNLNKNLKINSIKEISLDFLSEKKRQNTIFLKKNKKNYVIRGKVFDASTLISNVLESNNTDSGLSSIFNNLNTDIDIKIDKIFIDKISHSNDLRGNIKIISNEINELNLISNFPDEKKITLKINTNNDNEKITTLFSSYPRPLVNQYKFIKGFEEGVLDFQSIKKNNISKSVLNIDNFKVKEVPALAKLLSLASLQGIADLLTGEGIRFTDFEMKFSNEGKLMKIEEIYAIGPAISIMMEGYIESEKLISLRGTLVPARTINRTIASIPLIGSILVGKKIGEGVFGVSFKIKGPPENLKTSVNPVKTLTPRFITRTLEKIKKN